MLKWNRTSASVFSWRFTAYLQNTFLKKHLSRVASARTKKEDLYHRNFFYTMRDSDAHYILKCVLMILMMKSTRWILTVLMKFGGNAF